MVKIGFIGYGSMGSMLLQGFIKSGAILPSEVIVSTRTKNKFGNLKSIFTDINIADSNTEVANKAKYIFLCVKPLEVKNVLYEIIDALNSESVIICLAGPVTSKVINDITHGKVAKLTPSVTSEVNEGIALIYFNNYVNNEEADYITLLLRDISKIRILNDEDDFAVSAKLTSCGPGFLSAILDEFVESALRQSSVFTREDIEDMVVCMFFGTAKLLYEKNMKFNEMIQRVATKGGLTEEGVKVFHNHLPEVFDKVFEATLRKGRMLRENIEDDFDKKQD